MNQATSNGWTPLMSAAKNGQLDVAQFLVQQGAEVDRANSNGWLPFMIAAQEGHLEVAKFLLQQGTEAAVDQAVKLLMEKSPGVVNIQNKDGYTFLHIAILAGNEAVAQVLIDNDSIDLEIQDNYGQTPLLLAVEEKLPGVVKRLLDK